jgi:O-succinylbenzoate synthase
MIPPSRLAYRRYRLAFRNPLRTAGGLWPERAGLIVRWEGEDGRIGWGEAAPIPSFGMETVDELAAACAALGPAPDAQAIGRVPARLGCLRHALAAAAVELAGGGPSAAHGFLPVAALVPAGPAALARIPGLAEAGFRTFKWKVGAGDLQDELVLLDEVCGALPAGAKLRLDANGAWDRRGAERWLERCADRPVEFLEQPVGPQARGAADLLMGLAADYPTPIALDESVVADGDLERWLGAGWPGLFVIKPTLLADPPAALERLRAAGARVVFSSALETAVGARSALQLAFSWPGEARALGFGVWPLFAIPGFDGPAAAPFVRIEDLDRLDRQSLWNALT